MMYFIGNFHIIIYSVSMYVLYTTLSMYMYVCTTLSISRHVCMYVCVLVMHARSKDHGCLVPFYAS